MKISVIITCYNEEAVLPMLFAALGYTLNTLAQHTFELLFIDDGSNDQTLSCIKNYSLSSPKNSTVKYISFTRNFGKEAAILAGLNACRGSAVCIMDADLQDPPRLIADMIPFIESGFDMVIARRIGRGSEPLYRHVCSWLFCRIINLVSADIHLLAGERDFRMVTASAANEIAAMPEHHRFTKGLFCLPGYRTKVLEYRNTARAKSQSKWTFFKLMRYASDAIIDFSDLPLRLISLFSTLTAAAAIVCLSAASTAMFAVFLSAALILCSVRITGAYAKRIYDEVRRRPLYTVHEANIDDTENTEAEV